jgi:hypothetical protein
MRAFCNKLCSVCVCVCVHPCFLVYTLHFQLYGFVSFYTQLRLILFIYWSLPLLVNKLLISSRSDYDHARNRDCDHETRLNLLHYATMLLLVKMYSLKLHNISCMVSLVLECNRHTKYLYIKSNLILQLPLLVIMETNIIIEPNIIIQPNIIVELNIIIKPDIIIKPYVVIKPNISYETKHHS